MDIFEIIAEEKKSILTIFIASVALTAVIFIVITSFATMVLKHDTATPDATPETFTYQLSLSGGEYVWHVARRCARPDEDIREIVYKIEKASGMKSAGQVKPGQLIQVPVSCVDEFTVVGRVE